MHILLESHEREWRTTGALSSLLVHGALLGLVLLAYADRPQSRSTSDEWVAFLLPPDRKAGADGNAARAGVTLGAPIADEGAPATEDVAAGPARSSPEAAVADTAADQTPSDPYAELLGDSVHTEFEVDSAVRRYAESRAPAYPPELLERNVEGRVQVLYIVDSAGRVDTNSLRVVTASHPAFVRAVKNALPGMRFRPALISGKPVRQLVEQSFSFKIRPPSTPPPPPPPR